MAKTRRKKINKSPSRPYRNAKAFIADRGDMITTAGVRGRTKVVRVRDENDKRVTSVRSVMVVPQVAAKTGRARDAEGAPTNKPRGIFVGRWYTGIARSKVYPTHGAKRGGVAPKPAGLMARAAKAVKRVVVRDGAK
jgi:hypothetical protein